MVRRSYTAEQIINKLREAEVYLSQGLTVGEASRKMGIALPTRQMRLQFSAPARVSHLSKLITFFISIRYDNSDLIFASFFMK